MADQLASREGLAARTRRLERELVQERALGVYSCKRSQLRRVKTASYQPRPQRTKDSDSVLSWVRLERDGAEARDCGGGFHRQLQSSEFDRGDTA
jgi:hypothetical protein